MVIDGLLKSEDLSTRQINTKASKYMYRSARPSDKENLEQEGWELIPSKSAKTIRMKKDKSHYDAFEDRVWALFAKLNFNYLN
jgi:DNA sulfur modification protein DndB